MAIANCFDSRVSLKPNEGNRTQLHHCLPILLLAGRFDLLEPVNIGQAPSLLLSDSEQLASRQFPSDSLKFT